jgi:4-amino-4-deoxy-L-arabinose transferase-like glycosyltransferase
LSALIAVAPLQIHLAQRALIDGYFAFWAILCAWSLWENLQARPQSCWLLTYGISLFVLVLTKENAAFVFLALIAVAVLFAVTRLGRLNWQLLSVTLIAPTLAVIFLSTLVGGLGEWISFYRGFVAKSATLPYPAKFQDGAWYRYIVDFTLLSPVIVALFFGALFQLKKESKPDVFWAVFLGASFIGMSSVPLGMSLRFAAYWDVPLRWLATSQLFQLSTRFPRLKRPLALFACLLLLCAVDLFQYWRYFMQGAIYDPVSFQLLHAAKLIK